MAKPKKRKKKKKDKRISLAPLSYQEAVKALLQTKPTPKGK